MNSPQTSATPHVLPQPSSQPQMQSSAHERREYLYFEWLYCSKFSSLTNSECRFCASLRISASLKGAANIMGIAIATAHTHCRNIKRKVGINGGERLYTFLVRNGEAIL